MTVCAGTASATAPNAKSLPSGGVTSGGVTSSSAHTWEKVRNKEIVTVLVEASHTVAADQNVTTNVTPPA